MPSELLGPSSSGTVSTTFCRCNRAFFFASVRLLRSRLPSFTVSPDVVVVVAALRKGTDAAERWGFLRFRFLCGTDSVAKLSPFTHEARRLSDGHVDDVEAMRSHEDAIDATSSSETFGNHTESAP